MAEFLTGKALADRVRVVCREDKVDCAVAFWGRAIRDDLFPVWKRQKIRIVCDIAMGCNAQAALVALGAPDNARLRVHDGLHAKVYLSDAGVVIGSPNASPRGIGIGGRDPGNLEAGTFHEHGSPIWVEAQAWFDGLFKAAKPLDAVQLARAPEHARDPGSIIGEGPDDQSILNLVRGYRRRFDDTLFIGEAESMTDEQLQKRTTQYKAAEAKGAFEPADRDLIVDAPPGYLPGSRANVLMFWHGKRPRVHAWTNVVEVRSGKYTTLWGVESWKSFWAAHGGGPMPKALTAEYRDFALSIDDGLWARTSQQLQDLLTDT